MQYLKKPCLEILAPAEKSGNIYYCHFTNFLPQAIIYSISSPEVGALVTYLCFDIVRPRWEGKITLVTKSIYQILTHCLLNHIFFPITTTGHWP